MIHFWLIVVLINIHSSAFGSLASDKQVATSSSENAENFVGLLGNASGISLHTKLAQDAQQYEREKKVAKQLQTSSTSVDLKQQREASKEASLDEERACIEDINQQLQGIYKATKNGIEQKKLKGWNQQKKIIAKAIKDGIHPDLLLNAHGGFTTPDSDDLSLSRQRLNKFLIWQCTPLYTAITNNDVVFARFLLEHGANPNQSKGHRSEAPYIKKGQPVLLAVQSLAMLDLLLEYGAATTIKIYGFECLKAAIKLNSPELVQRYVEHDACINNDQETTLGNVVKESIYGIEAEREANVLIIMHILMEAGAALNQRVHHCDELCGPIPRFLKKIRTPYENAIKEDPIVQPESDRIIETFKRQRAVLIEACNNRQLKITALVSALSATNLIPPLITIITHYYVPNEPTYEQLEAMDDTAAAPQPETATAAATISN